MYVGRETYRATEEYLKGLFEALRNGESVEEYNERFRAEAEKRGLKGFEVEMGYVESVAGDLQRAVKAYDALDWGLVRRFVESVNPAETYYLNWFMAYIVGGEKAVRERYDSVFAGFDREFLEDLGLVIRYVVKRGYYSYLGGFDRGLVEELKKYDYLPLMPEELLKSIRKYECSPGCFKKEALLFMKAMVEDYYDREGDEESDCFDW